MSSLSSIPVPRELLLRSELLETHRRLLDELSFINWIKFSRQDEALESIDRFNKEILSPFDRFHCWAYELPSYPDLSSRSSGSRYFIAADFRSFFVRYATMKSARRHFYELIHADEPSKLYFDLEFSLKENPELASPQANSAIFRRFLRILDIFLHRTIDFTLPTQFQFEYVVLDSSTPQKFSRHLIVNARPPLAFHRNVEILGFVKLFEKFVQERSEKEENFVDPIERHLKLSFPNEPPLTPADYSSLFVNFPAPRDSTRSVKQLFIDQAVYTRNRCFRLFLSCKNIHSEHKICPPLVVSADSSQKFRDASFEQKFFDHLIQLIAPAEWRASVGFRQSKKRKTTENSADPQLIYLIRWPPENSIGENGEWTAESIVEWKNWNFNREKIETKMKNSMNSNQIYSSQSNSQNSSISSHSLSISNSPFPALEFFLLNHLHSSGQKDARIKQWKYSNQIWNNENENSDGSQAKNSPIRPQFEFSQLLLLLAGTRFCYSINRNHKSNGVYIVVYLKKNIQTGKFTGEFVQKCFDPDCKSFTPKAMEIPPNVINEQNEKNSESKNSADSDDEKIFEQELLAIELPNPKSIVDSTESSSIP